MPTTVRAHSPPGPGGEAVAISPDDAAGAAAGGPMPTSSAGAARAGLPLLQSLRLAASSAYYTTADALGLRKLGDMITGATTLPPSPAPLHLLGVCYASGSDTDTGAPGPSPAALAALAADLASQPRFTYRRGLAVPIPCVPAAAGGGGGPTPGLASDVGWGCTLRSGQALVAQALWRAGVGRAWRRVVVRAGGGDGPPGAPAPPPHPPPACINPLPPVGASILRAFADDPAAPLSLHALIAAGGPASPGAGEWWGPWAFCHAAAAALRGAAAGRGDAAGLPALRVLLLAGPGGGAPSVSVRDGGWGGRGEESAASCQHADDDPACLPPGQGGAGERCGQGGRPPSPRPPPPAPLLVLVPLVLGAGRALNPVYTPSLASVLTWPQSLGMLAGRKGAALWVVGSQGAGPALVVDPHTPQAAVADPADEAAPDGGGPCPADSYFGAPLRTAPLCSLDPSLALGFLCGDGAAWADLVDRLAGLEAGAPGAPLVCVREGSAAERGGRGGRRSRRVSRDDDGGWVVL